MAIALVGPAKERQGAIDAVRTFGHEPHVAVRGDAFLVSGHKLRPGVPSITASDAGAAIHLVGSPWSPTIARDALGAEILARFQSDRDGLAAWMSETLRGHYALFAIDASGWHAWSDPGGPQQVFRSDDRRFACTHELPLAWTAGLGEWSWPDAVHFLTHGTAMVTGSLFRGAHVTSAGSHSQQDAATQTPHRFQVRPASASDLSRELRTLGEEIATAGLSGSTSLTSGRDARLVCAMLASGGAGPFGMHTSAAKEDREVVDQAAAALPFPHDWQGGAFSGPTRGLKDRPPVIGADTGWYPFEDDARALERPLHAAGPWSLGGVGGESLRGSYDLPGADLDAVWHRFHRNPMLFLGARAERRVRQAAVTAWRADLDGRIDGCNDLGHLVNGQIKFPRWLGGMVRRANRFGLAYHPLEEWRVQQTIMGLGERTESIQRQVTGALWPALADVPYDAQPPFNGIFSRLRRVVWPMRNLRPLHRVGSRATRLETWDNGPVMGIPAADIRGSFLVVHAKRAREIERAAAMGAA